MNHMNARDIIAMSLSGFDTDCDETGSAESILGMTLEKAISETRLLLRSLDGSTDEALVAGAIEGRLTALDRFVAKFMSVAWKPGVEGEVES